MTESELDSLKKDVAALSHQVAELRKEISDLGEAFMGETSNTTQYIKAFYSYIHDYLMPVVNKVVPEYAATIEQIDSFMERHGGPKGPRKIS